MIALGYVGSLWISDAASDWRRRFKFVLLPLVMRLRY